MELQQRVLCAKEDEREFEALVTAYRPFISSVASRTTGKFISSHDDEMSVALIAFAEAVRRFDPASGGFLPFAEKVIHSRLIDSLRSQSRAPKTVSLDGDERARQFSNNRETIAQSRWEDPLKMEIEALSKTLSAYGFGFFEVAKQAPKHAGTKKACAAAAKCVVSDTVLREGMQNKKQLPVSAICDRTGVSPKLMGKHRTYIVCLVEILCGGYVYLSDYVKFVKEATK